MSRTADIRLPNDATAFLDAMVSAGHATALVGGVVRDTLLSRPVRDLDAVTSASPDDVRAACEGASWCRRIFNVGERYGTVGVVLADGAVVEVSQLRSEGDAATAPDHLEATGAHGCADFQRSFAADAAHRDFTANALAAVWPDLAIFDPTGGVRDIESRVLRAPGDAATRLAEDPLRVLRAARFEAELGFTVEPATRAALVDASPLLARVAAERVRDELTSLLIAPHAQRGLETLRMCGALAIVLGEVAALDGLEQPTFHDLDALSHTLQAVGAIRPTLMLRWAALLHDVGKAPARTIEADGRIRFFRHAQLGADLADGVCHRLRFSNAERTAIVHLVRGHMRLGELPLDSPRAVDRAVRRLDLWADGANPPRRLVSAEDALELELADFAATAHRSEAPSRRRAMEAALVASRERGTRQPPARPLSGRELIAELGIAEGPQVGVALAAVADAVAEGLIAADDRVGALAAARKALGNATGAPDSGQAPSAF